MNLNHGSLKLMSVILRVHQSTFHIICRNWDDAMCVFQMFESFLCSIVGAGPVFIWIGCKITTTNKHNCSLQVITNLPSLSPTSSFSASASSLGRDKYQP